MFNRWRLLGLCLSFGVVACGAAPDEGQDPNEHVGTTQLALTSNATATGSATPESGTMLPVSPARAAHVPLPTGVGFETPIVNVPGITNDSAVRPPDTIGDVGLDHYIQMVNAPRSLSGGPGAVFTIFDKSGAPVSPEVTNVPLTELVATEGGCSTGYGDPIVNYDREADRWLLLQFADNALAGNHLCLYVSPQGEPEALDDWQLYDFDLATLVDLDGNPAPGGFPDYFKVGIWSDGYYVTTNDTGAAQVPAIYALERDAILSGDTARIQRFELPVLSGSLFQPATPVDWDSTLPPPDGAPGLILRRIDDEIQAPPGNPAQDALELWDVDVDFDTPANSTLDGPTTIPTADFDTNICDSLSFTNPCADQPSTSQRLSVIAYVALWRLHYRNFGDREAILGNFDVDDGSSNPAPFWFELERSGVGAWSLAQSATYTPDTSDRWMGSAAMDGEGNIALGYSVSSSTLFPSIRYTGRRATDPPSTMTAAEASIADGERAQIGDDRWGDYSAMNVDPGDDCTFWYTNEYYTNDTTGTFEWSTRIASFRFPDCGVAPVCVLGETKVDLRDRANVTADLAAGNYLEVGAPATLNGDGVVGGNALIRSNGVVNGDLLLGGTLMTQGSYTITGTLTQNGDPVIPELETKTFSTGSGFQQITGNVTLTPGNYGNVYVRPDASVTLNAGTYNFASLTVETDVTFVANGMVEVNVQGNFEFGDRSEVIGGNMLAVYANGNNVRIGTNVTFNGILVAPNANVNVYSRTHINGCVGGENVTFEPDTVLDSDGHTLPVSGGVSPEEPPTGALNATAAVFNDWGSGYCANVSVTNPTATATTTWSVTMDLHGSIITGSWNGAFSGTTGVITVGPGFDWNQSIPPGQTNSSVGFCANRPPGAGTASVTSATGSF